MTLKKIGGGKRKLRGGQSQKTRAEVWQWVPTFKEAVPPPPPGTKVLHTPPPQGQGSRRWLLSLPVYDVINWLPGDT